MRTPLLFIADRLADAHPQIARNCGSYIDISDDRSFCFVSNEDSLATEKCSNFKYAICFGRVAAELCHSKFDVVIQVDPAVSETKVKKLLYQAKAEYDTWNIDLMNAITNSTELVDFLEVGKQMIHCPLAVENLFGQILAYTAGYGSKEIPCQVRGKNLFAVTHGGQQFAVLKLEIDSRDISGGTLSLAEHFVSMLELYYRVFGSANKHSVESYDIIGDMVDGKHIERSIVEMHLSKHGWRSSDTYQVIAAFYKHAPLDSSRLDMLVKQLKAEFPRTLYYSDDSKTILIVNLRNREQSCTLSDYISEHLSNTGISFGISPEFCNYYLLHRFGCYALYALDKAASSVDSLNILRFKDVRTLFMKEYLLESEKLSGDIGSSLADKLAAADNGGNQLVKTLFTFLLCGMNNTVAARKLYIDRNSLVYRLGKINAILGIDVTKLSQEDYGYLYLMISCYLIMIKKNEC